MQRIDIFSQKGGVGKTSLAILMAKHFVSKKRNVLIVDADLTGSCIGDAIAPDLIDPWESIPGLTQLICGSPDLLLDNVANTPIYWFDPSWTDIDIDKMKIQPPTGFGICFCPSHLYPDVGSFAKILRALAAHETSGNWVRHVIQMVINQTRQIVGDEIVVIVDHSPGMAALQQAALEDIRANAIERKNSEELSKLPNNHVALMITSADKADLNMCLWFQETQEALLSRANGSTSTKWAKDYYFRFVANNLAGTPPKDLRKLKNNLSVPKDDLISNANTLGQLAQIAKISKSTSTAIAKLCDWTTDSTKK